jgi:acetyl-CoA synthetase
VRFANVLNEIGVRKGTPVAIYMGMVPELPVAMLACTRLGAPHTVVFGGFSADSLSGRMNDMQCEVLITQDAGWRKGNEVPLKKTADAAMADAPGVGRCLVVHRKDSDVEMQEGRDVWYHELAEGVSDDPESCPCEPMDSEDLLFLMYTSGDDGETEGDRSYDSRLPRRRLDNPPLHLRREARAGRVLVCGRHRLDHRP